jgi:heme/copper-type cytochrome/quinol oxidase subunit 3
MTLILTLILIIVSMLKTYAVNTINKGNNKITELRTILQRESQNS